MRTWQRRTAAACVLAAVMAGCAAHSLRDKARVATLTVGEAILAVDAAEWTLFNSKIPNYTQADHDRVGAIIRRLLYAGRAFNTAVQAWPPEVKLVPASVDAAVSALMSILGDLEKALPQGAKSILTAIAGIKQALSGWQVEAMRRIGPDEEARLAAAIAVRDVKVVRLHVARGGRP